MAPQLRHMPPTKRHCRQIQGRRTAATKPAVTDFGMQPYVALVFFLMVSTRNTSLRVLA